MSEIMKKFAYLFYSCVIAGLLLCSAACSTTPGGESAGEFIDSSATTTKIKADLIDALGTKAFGIQVKTFKDEVQLSGFVNSDYLKKRAGIIAGDHVAIKHVRNDLIVR